MKVGIYYLSSLLHDESTILKQREAFLKELKYEFIEVKQDEFNKYPLTLILIETGGSEAKFKELSKKVNGPYYILTKGDNNSLAASLEILRYIHINHQKGEILHGSFDYINNRIKELLTLDNLGVIGKPSDWLIASDVNYNDALSKFNVNLIDISLDEVIANYQNDDNSYKVNGEFDKEELSKAYKLYKAFRTVKDKYNLKGLTIRCFDLLGALHTTGCLGLSLLNDEGITGTCEGDVPSLLAMYLLNRDLNLLSFQANPSRIDLDNQQMIVAHCTIPLKMTLTHNYDTHFESKIGVAIHGELPLDKVTIFKISNDLKYYYVGSGTITKNLYLDTLCRTQIEIKYADDLTYYLNRSLANHHLFVIGDHKDAIINMMTKYGLERVK